MTEMAFFPRKGQTVNVEKNGEWVDEAPYLEKVLEPDQKVHRAYTFLETRALDEEKRIITGVATTPEPDRMGDVVEPLGIQFKNPMPLLWQHDTEKVIGTVRFDKPTKAGVNFEARLPKVEEPGTLKDRVDEAWQSIKLGLVSAVSIGFRSLERSQMKDGGIRFIATEVLELSVVTIPMNASATIEQVKSIDAKLLAATGKEHEGERGVMGRSGPIGVDGCVGRPGLKGEAGIPGDSGKNKQTVSMKSAPKDARKMPMTIQEQIAGFEAKRMANSERASAILSKAAEDGRTLDESESEEHDNLQVDITKIDEHLVRLRAHEAQNKAAAKPVVQPAVAQPSEAVIKAASQSHVQYVKPNVPPGTAFTRYALAVLRGSILRMSPLEIAKQEKSWHNTPEVELSLSVDIPSVMKTAVGAGTTTDATWASPLVAYNVLSSEFIELLRPATIIGRIPGLRRVPFNIQMPRTTTGTSVGWVGENAPKPVTSMAFDTVQLRWAKAAGIVILTDELVRFSNPSAEAVVRSDIIDAMAQFLDRQFVDPSVAAVTNVSPASITNGVSAVTPTGTNAAAFRADVATMFGTLFTNNLSTAGGVWIMTQTQALKLALMQNSLGQAVFPDISAEGGTLLGYPVVTSENIPSTSGSPIEGYPIIFLIPREIMLADDGQVVVDASREASVQMDTAPDSPPTASSNMVSLWQMNMTGLRAERWINWLKRRSTVVQYIANARYAE